MNFTDVPKRETSDPKWTSASISCGNREATPAPIKALPAGFDSSPARSQPRVVSAREAPPVSRCGEQLTARAALFLLFRPRRGGQ